MSFKGKILNTAKPAYKNVDFFQLCLIKKVLICMVSTGNLGYLVCCMVPIFLEEKVLTVGPTTSLYECSPFLMRLVHSLSVRYIC